MSSRLLRFDVQHNSKLFTREMINLTKFISQPSYPEHYLLKINKFDAQIAFSLADRTVKNNFLCDVILLPRDKKLNFRTFF